MSTDIGPILAKCSGGNERHLLTQLLPSVSKISLQNYINSLSSKCDQQQRVECLRTVLQHSTELCQDNGDKLLPILNRIIQRPGICGQLASSVYKCLSLIIQASVNSSETGKNITATTPSIVNTILTVKPGDGHSSSALSLLSILMSKYSGACGQQRPKIQETLISHLNSSHNSEARVKLLGKCLILMCRIGGGGKEGAEHSSHFNTLLATLVSTIHTGLNTMYSGIKELDHHSSFVSLATPWKLHDGNVEHLAWQLESILGAMSQLLVRGFPHMRRIPVDSLLSIPVRVIGLNLDRSKLNTPQQYLVSSLHSMLCCSTLTMTIALIRTLRDQLLPEAGTINSLILSGLAQTREKRVKVSLYKFMSVWLECAGAGSGAEYCVGQIVTHLIGDIVPVEQKMMLQYSGGGRRGKKRKGGTNGRVNQTQNTNESAKPSEIDNELANAAVKTMEQIVTSIGPWLDKDVNSKITKCVLSQLIASDDDTDTERISRLVSCLHALVSTSAPTHRSPVNLSIPLITNLMANPRLSAQARNFLTSIHTMIHPARFTMDISDSKMANQESLSVPEDILKEDDVELELIESFTQTEVTEASENVQKVEVKDDERIKKLEQELARIKRLESEARADIMRKEIEISRLKISAEKRPSSATTNGKISGADDGPSVASKRAKMIEDKVEKKSLEKEEEDMDLPTLDSENSDKSKLSVEEMLKDFSNKLNKNIIPKFTQDSDSD